MIDFRIEYLPAINYALINNKIAVCQSAEIRNTSTDTLHNLVVECTGEYFITTLSATIDALRAYDSMRLDKVDILPNPQMVGSLTEKLVTTFTIKVYQDIFTEGEPKSEIFSKEYNVDIMPFDQWLGTSILPQCLASYVMPNHPAISNIVVKAAKLLKDITGTSAFTEYQSGSPNEVLKQVAAVYGALHNENIVYRGVPASYEEIGQRITLPDQVLAQKLGNCVELTLLYASVLENIGINSCIILQRGHAYLGVWLVDDCCPYSVCDDYSYIEKKCSEGINEMIVLECTQITEETTSFEKAQQIAAKNLANTAAFEMFIDLRRCRLEKVRPFPQRVDNNGNLEFPALGVDHDQCDLEVKEHSRYDLSKIMESKRTLTKMDIWERKLLDFSLRNSMLNLYLRQKAIQFISFDVDLIEDYLQDGNEYVIQAKPNVEIRTNDEERLLRSKLHPELHELITNDIKHQTLHTYQTELETQHTLKNIYRAARNAIEETGANALFLTIGTLRWFETDYSETPRYAPILMLPVEMVYKKGHYYIRSREEEITLNITLIEFLRQNFDITIPGLDPLPTDDHGVDVKKIFSIIREVLKDKKRWDVEEESILGIFSFSKFLMWNDIHNHRDELLSNEIVNSLVEQKLTFNPTEVISNLKDTDKSIKPDQLALPVSVDSSQMAAVIEAGQGHSFILYGPPGTGKSQTITNLIANALFQGKRVLFVAEKMAALSVVQNRLEKIGLAPFCLEMHSNKITKRHVLDQLKTALEVTHIVKPEEYSRIADQLYGQRLKLIEYMEALHEVTGSEGLSAYDCIFRFQSINADELPIDTTDEQLRNSFKVENLNNYQHLLNDKYAAIINLVGQPSAHPLLGLDLSENDLTDVNSMASSLKETASLLQGLESDYQRLAQATSLRAKLLRDNNEAIFNVDANDLYQQWREAKAKWFIPRFFAKRNFVKQMRQYNALITAEGIDSLLDNLIDYQALHSEIGNINSKVNLYFNKNYTGDNLPTIEEARAYTTQLTQWASNMSKARDWYHWCEYKRELQNCGLAVVAQLIEGTPVPAGTLCDSFLKTMFKSLASEKIAQSPILRTFEGSIFDETVSLYQKLTEEFRMLSQKELYAHLASQIPHVTSNIDSSSEIGYLNRNISSGGRGTPLRELMDHIPTLLPRLCPCMLMSPMSVAQFLTLSQDKFDIIIFDEASQMPTSEAVGAIARGKSLIVVGDPKQMPPTSFFNSTSVNEDEADIDDMESILEDCRTLAIPALQLNWHYRSQHESLIAFSNNEYYDGSLITFPSVDDQTTKVKYNYIDGTYDKGGRRSNKEEAQAIVADIAKRLARPDHAHNSIGVIAFSVAQQNLIEDLLDDLLENNSALKEAANEMYEPIFVKNLENVQGDERDIIMFSIGYGPDKYGRVSMNFGPLNNAGGERRLNVAVSRARKEMTVYSSLKSSHIDLNRSKARGVAGLKHFLEYAESQVLLQSSNCKHDVEDSVIAEQIANALRKKGYQVNTNVGRSNFKIDVALCDSKNKGNYLLGILLDGKGYYNTQTTRDREIVQPSVLKNLNWRIMRVWSVDWFYNPDRVIDRIEKFINDNPTPPIPQEHQEFDISQETIETVQTNLTDYQTLSTTINASKMTDHELVSRIVQCEQPITLPYLCRRVASYRDTVRVTPKITSTVTQIVAKSLYTQSTGDCKTVWMSKQAADEFVGYRQHNSRDITEIPPVEVINATREALAEQLSISLDALTLIVAKKMGFTRRGTKVDQAMNAALKHLTDNGIIENIDGMMRLTNS